MNPSLNVSSGIGRTTLSTCSTFGDFASSLGIANAVSLLFLFSLRAALLGLVLRLSSLFARAFAFIILDGSSPPFFFFFQTTECKWNHTCERSERQWTYYDLFFLEETRSCMIGCVISLKSLRWIKERVLFQFLRAPAFYFEMIILVCPLLIHLRPKNWCCKKMAINDKLCGPYKKKVILYAHWGKA